MPTPTLSSIIITSIYPLQTNLQNFNLHVHSPFFPSFHVNATIIMMLVRRALVGRALFCSLKEEYGRYFVIRLCFGPDGFYQSNQHRPEFLRSLSELQKQRKAVVLGGESFPFGTSCFYFNCDDPATAESFLRDNVFVRSGLAKGTMEEVERVSSQKMSNVANFYQMRLEI